MFLSRKFGTLLFLFAFSLCVVGGSGLVAAQDKEDEVDLQSLFQEARMDIGNEDYAEAAEKLAKITKAESDNGAAWQLLGYSLHLDGKLDEAIVAHQKAAGFAEYKQLGLYNLGCAYSLKNETDKSLKFLHEALDAGFDQFEMFDSDADLVNVKKVEGFKEIEARADNDGKRPEKKFDAKSLVGDWAITSGTRQGEDIDANRLPVIKISAKDLTIPAGEGEFVMSYKLVDASKDIIKIDFKIESGPAPEGAALGIMKVDGNKAKLCYDPTGQKRPTKFETTPENGCFLFVLEKKKADGFDASKVVGKWKVTEGTRDGEKVAEDRLAEANITFKKDTITIPAGEESFVMSYTIDSDSNPIQIDMKIESGPAPEGSPAFGILKFEDDKFILCYNATGGDRPEKFESTAENGNFLFTMKPNKDE